MNYPRLIFTIFLAVSSILVLAIWSDIYAQQSYSPSSIPLLQSPQLANGAGSGNSTNVPIVLRPLPSGSCPQGYHLVSATVCIKDIPSSDTSQTSPTPTTTNTTNSFSTPSPSTTSQPNGNNPTNNDENNNNNSSNNEQNFGTKILKSFNQEFR